MPRLTRPVLASLATGLALGAGLLAAPSALAGTTVGGCNTRGVVCFYDGPNFTGTTESVGCGRFDARREVRLGRLLNRATSVINGCTLSVGLHAVRTDVSQRRPRPYNTTLKVFPQQRVADLHRVVGTDQAFERYPGLDNSVVGVFAQRDRGTALRGFPKFG